MTSPLNKPAFFLKLFNRIKARVANEELFNEFLFFAISTGTFQISRLFVNLIAAKWIGPDDFGVWNGLYLFLLYGVLVSLGVPNGMNREVPLLAGSGRKDLADQTANASFLFVLLTSSVGAILTAVILSTRSMGALSTTGLISMVILFFMWQIYQYGQMRLRSNIRFRLMTIQQFAFALLLPAIALPLTSKFKLPGFIGGQAIAVFITIFVIWRIGSFKLEFQFTWPIIRKLMKVGFPIMAAGLLYSLLTSIDRWVILRFLGVEALGQYTLAILSVGILNLLPSVISQQLYPRMAFQYGQTSDKRALLPIVVRQTLASLVLTIPLIAAAIATLPFLVQAFLPEYVGGIRSARILLLGLAFIPLTGGVANFLNTIDKQGYYLGIQAGAVLINFCLDILLVKMGWGLTGVACGAAVSYVLFALTMVLAGVWIINRE